MILGLSVPSSSSPIPGGSAPSAPSCESTGMAVPSAPGVMSPTRNLLTPVLSLHLPQKVDPIGRTPPQASLSHRALPKPTRTLIISSLMRVWGCCEVRCIQKPPFGRNAWPGHHGQATLPPGIASSSLSSWLISSGLLSGGLGGRCVACGCGGLGTSIMTTSPPLVSTPAPPRPRSTAAGGDAPAWLPAPAPACIAAASPPLRGVSSTIMLQALSLSADPLLSLSDESLLASSPLRCCSTSAAAEALSLPRPPSPAASPPPIWLCCGTCLTSSAPGGDAPAWSSTLPPPPEAASPQPCSSPSSICMPWSSTSPACPAAPAPPRRCCCPLLSPAAGFGDGCPRSH